jgi:iron complex transport system substrate-binding protein
MKTKNKLIASLEIAIVLCSLFLATMPAIAAEQVVTQEVSAAEVTTASEDDFVLDIYGNANEDDTIDMRDLTYVKLIFFGKKPVAELADAKYDGKINPLDFIQIKLIIVGKEKELTVVDGSERIVTVKKPVERVILLTSSYQGEMARILRIQDKIVGVPDLIKQEEIYFPELSKLPSIGSPLGGPPDYEVTLSLNPDLVITSAGRGTTQHAKKLPGITVVGINLWKSDVITKSLVKLGYIFGKKDEAKRYTDDFHDKYIDPIKAQTEGLSEEERPRVYVESKSAYRAYGAKSGAHQFIDICGGRNIFADIGKPGQVDPEEIIKRNPDIIIKYIPKPDAGYEYDDISKIKALWEDTINRPELANVNAVRNRKVYIIDDGLNYGSDYPIALTYWAKWFHPELFEDFDPREIHQEFLTEFQRLDYDLDKHGVFVYPEPS